MLKVFAKPEEDVIFIINNNHKVKGFIIRNF